MTDTHEPLCPIALGTHCGTHPWAVDLGVDECHECCQCDLLTTLRAQVADSERAQARAAGLERAEKMDWRGILESHIPRGSACSCGADVNIMSVHVAGVVSGLIRALR